MGICKFKVNEVLRCVLHAVNNTPKDGPLPSILLVHDDGVYIMSNAKPADIDGDRSYTAYAEGCDPRKDEDYYQTSKDLVGGDDFGEVLELDLSLLADFAAYKDLLAAVTENSIELKFSNPKT